MDHLEIFLSWWCNEAKNFSSHKSLPPGQITQLWQQCLREKLLNLGQKAEQTRVLCSFVRLSECTSSLIKTVLLICCCLLGWLTLHMSSFVKLCKRSYYRLLFFISFALIKEPMSFGDVILVTTYACHLVAKHPIPVPLTAGDEPTGQRLHVSFSGCAAPRTKTQPSDAPPGQLSSQLWLKKGTPVSLIQAWCYSSLGSNS